MSSTTKKSGNRSSDAAPKIYLLSIHRYRHDETWHPVAAFGWHEEIVGWLEQHHTEYPHGYAIETVPFLSCEERGASGENLDPRNSFPDRCLQP